MIAFLLGMMRCGSLFPIEKQCNSRAVDFFTLHRYFYHVPKLESIRILKFPLKKVIGIEIWIRTFFYNHREDSLVIKVYFNLFYLIFFDKGDELLSPNN